MASTVLIVLLVLLVLAVLGILVYAVWFSPTALKVASAASSSGSGTSIDVEGSGTVQAVPDIALVQIGVETQAASVEEATRQNNANSTAVQQSVSAVLGTNKSNADIQTTQYSVIPVYPDSSSTTGSSVGGGGTGSQPIAYRVVHELTVRISAEKDSSSLANSLGARASAVVDAATKAGANNVGGPTFQVSQKSPERLRARELAVRNAQRNAADLARLAGVTLGPLQRLSESSSFDSSPMFAMASARSLSANSATPIQSGTNQVTYRVSASYAVGAPIVATQ